MPFKVYIQHKCMYIVHSFIHIFIYTYNNFGTSINHYGLKLEKTQLLVIKQVNRLIIADT